MPWSWFVVDKYGRVLHRQGVKVNMRILEELDGRGTVSRDGKVLFSDVPYRITIYQDELPAGRDVVLGMRRLRGSLGVDLHQGSELVTSGEPFTLTLEDGRGVNLRMSNLDGKVVRAGGGDL